MKKLLLSAGIIFAVLFCLTPRFTDTVNAAPSAKIEAIMGGGTAVLFSNGDLYDLTLSGWQKSGHLPPGVDVKNVKVVLTSNRIVEVDGTGWVQTGGVWRRIPSPNL